MLSRRTWIGLGLALIVLFVTCIVGANWLIGQYLSPEGLSEQLTSSLNRPVQVESVDFSIWSGIRIGGITIEGTSEPRTDLLRAESLYLGPEWWPLLYGKITISEAQLTSPYLNLVRDQTGAWNVLNGSDPPERDNSGGDSASAGSLSIQVDSVELKSPRVVYRDAVLDVADTVVADRVILNNLRPAEGADVTLEGLRGMGSQLNGQFQFRLSPFSITVSKADVFVDTPSKLFPEIARRFDVNGRLTGGSIRGTIRAGTLTPDTITATVSVRGNSNRWSGPGPTEANWESLALDGKLSLDPREGSGQVLVSRLELKGGVMHRPFSVDVSGRAEAVRVDLDRTHQNAPFEITGRLGPIEVSRGGSGPSLTLQRGTSRYLADQLKLSDLKIVHGATRLSGWLNVDGVGASTDLDGRLSLSPLDLATVNTFLPPELLPPATTVTGRLSSEAIKIAGSPSTPKFSGRISPDGINVKTDYLNVPLKLSDSSIQLEGDRVRLANGAFQLGEQSVGLTGYVRYRPRVSMDLSFDLDRLSVGSVLDHVRRPLFPTKWTPSGDVSGTVRVLGPVGSPRAEARLSSPRLSSNSFAGSEVDLRIGYGSGSFISHFELNTFSGHLKGELTVNEGRNSSRFRTDLSLDSAAVERLLVDLTGVGEGSRGSLDVDAQIKSGFSHPARVDGTVSARSDSLVIRDVAAVNQLGDALVKGISEGLGGELGILARQLIEGSLSDQRRELNRVFSERVTSEFDRLRGLVRFEDGEGTIERGILSNRYLKLSADGRIRTDGWLRTVVNPVPRTPLVNRARQDWLRRLLRAGLPPVKVTGRVTEPTYGIDDYGNVVTNLLTASSQSGTETGESEPSSEDRMKRRLLEELFE